MWVSVATAGLNTLIILSVGPLFTQYNLLSAIDCHRMIRSEEFLGIIWSNTLILKMKKKSPVSYLIDLHNCDFQTGLLLKNGLWTKQLQ